MGVKLSGEYTKCGKFAKGLADMIFGTKDADEKRVEWGNRRLTKKNGDGTVNIKTDSVSEAIWKLGQYEELEEQGLLPKLPCKVGNLLYEPTNRGTISVYEVTGISIKLSWIFVEWHIVEGFVYRNMNGIKAEEIGKTAFLTREEAEKELKRIVEAG